MRGLLRKPRQWLIFITVVYSATLTLLVFQNHGPPAPPPPPRVIYRRDYPTDQPTTFLLGIFTVMEDVQRRRLIRETMLAAAPDASVCSLQEYDKKKKGSCQIVYTFVVGGNPQAPTEWSEGTSRTLDANQMLKHEHDILYLNVKENMNSGKTTTWFDYGSSVGTFDYIAKADSDTLISIPQLQSYIVGHLPPGNQHPKVYGGFLNEFQACGGAGALCDKIRGKVYMSGQFYWLSRDLATYMVSPQIKAQTNFIATSNEDSDLGFRVLSYPEPISLSACNGAQFWKHPLKSEEAWLEEFHKLQRNNWQVVDSSNWMGGLYEEPASPTLMRSILGHIREANIMPIFLD